MTTRDPEYKVAEDPEYGFRRLDPVPDSEALSRFYESRYYDLVRKGGRAPEIRRSLEGGAEAARELEWLKATLFDDVSHVLSQHVAGKRVLDVGCGRGDLVMYLKEHGFDACGLEPSTDATEAARSRGLSVEAATFGEYAARTPEGSFQAFTFMNVFEHVPNPQNLLRDANRVLAKDGIISIRVPNDFNELQAAAQKTTGIHDYWVAVPDHVNYFTFDSLTSLLRRFNFEVFCSLTDFPMELFLLMGDDYVREGRGPECHRKRVTMEMRIPGDVRRKMYGALANVGLGRNMLVFAKKMGGER